MKNIFLNAGLIVVFLIGSKNTSAQYYFFDGEYYDNPILYEAGISLNAMNCLTDMGGKKGVGTKFLKDLNIGKTHISGGVFFSAAFKNAYLAGPRYNDDRDDVCVAQMDRAQDS